MDLRANWVVLAMVSVTAMVAVAPTTAAAQDVMSCTFDGLSGQLVDDENGTNGIDSINDDRSVDVEHGTYDFSGRANCSGFDEASGQTYLTHSDGANADIWSAGEYFNTLCGTGEATDADGSDTFIAPHADAAPIPIPTVSGVGYSIEFVAGKGELDIEDETYDGEGLVTIEPVAPGNCVTTDVSEFTVTGSFVIVEGTLGPDVDPQEEVDRLLEQVPPLPDDPQGVVDEVVDGVVPPGSGQPSATCVSPTADVIDSPVAGVGLRLKVQLNASSTWVCVRVASGGTVVGGKLVIEHPGGGGGGVPSVDDISTACRDTPGNQVPGPHPQVGEGTVAGQTVMLDTWWAGGTEAWVCAQLGSSKTRVKVPVPSASGGSARFERDAF